MKKILFALQTMVMGGVEKELITILNRLNPVDVDITLVLLYVQDESLLSRIPSYVKIVNLNIDKNYYCSNTISLVKKRFLKGAFLEAFSLLLKRIFCIGQTGSNLKIKNIPEIKGYFDTAICYHMHSPLVLKFVTEKVKANRRIAWIHNDFCTTGYKVERLKKLLDKYDCFVGVSNKLSSEFIHKCPCFTDRILTLHNVVDKNEIKKLSELPIKNFSIEKVKDKIVLVTVGRMEEQKGYDIAVRAASLLKSKYLNFVWLFIGGGSKELDIKTMVSSFGLENNIIFLGRQDNPYQYMKMCDIYIQPSRHEGFGLTISEAKVLNKPIICTDFIGADEQIMNGIDGVIVPCCDFVKIADSIMDLSRNRDKMFRMSDALKSENAEDVDGFCKIQRFILDI